MANGVLRKGSAMRHVIPWDELERGGPGSFTFVGQQFGASVCVLVGHGIPTGSGPRLHRHPYDEVFVVYDGTATFTLGVEALQVGARSVVIVPAGTPHKFVNSGDVPLYETSIHSSPERITEWLEE
jgi:mannose-6-phosphate isomerase-like protein (cupin superfamily)